MLQNTSSLLQGQNSNRIEYIIFDNLVFHSTEYSYV